MSFAKVFSRLFIPLLMGFATFCSAETVYKWVDENGHTHFGGRPPAHGTPEKIEFKQPVAPVSNSPATTPSAYGSPLESASSPSGLSMFPPRRDKFAEWCDKDAELCARVKQADRSCSTSLCDDAIRISACNTVICKADRLTLMKQLDSRIAAASAPRSASTYQPFPDNGSQTSIEPEFEALAAKTHGLLTAAEVKDLVQKCEASRGTNCRSSRYLNEKGWQAWERPWRKRQQ